MRGLDLKFGKQAIIVVDEVALDEHRTRCIVRNPESSRQTCIVSPLFVFLSCTPESQDTCLQPLESTVVVWIESEPLRPPGLMLTLGTADDTNQKMDLPS